MPARVLGIRIASAVSEFLLLLQPPPLLFGLTLRLL
jgi:hypothetical protein